MRKTEKFEMATRLILPIECKRVSIEIPTPVDPSSPTPPYESRYSNGRSMQERAELFRAIGNGDLVELQTLLAKAPILVNYIDEAGLTVLTRAVQSLRTLGPCIQVLEALLKCGANINATDSEGYSALHWAAACAEPDVLRFLCGHPGVDPRVVSFEGETPLHRASRLGRANNVAILVELYPFMSGTMNKQGLTALKVAGDWMGKTDSTRRDAVRSVFASHHMSLVLHHEDCMLHIPRTSGSQGDQPWESPDRITSILRSFKQLKSDPLVSIKSDFAPASDDEILRCHSKEYLHFLYEMDASAKSHSVPVPFTPAVQRSLAKLPLNRMKSSSLSDTSYSEGTLTAARRACGASLHAVRNVLDGHCRNAFCLVRPPGHHVGFNGPIVDCCNGSCGFSILNSVMVAAMEAIDVHKKRVAVIDIDVHHGNGTQHVVEMLGRPNELMFVSMHLFDGAFYPASGKDSNWAKNIHNIPVQPLWHPGSKGREDWMHAFENQLIPLVATFRPDVILMSTGFDGLMHDVGNQRHSLPESSRIGMDLTAQDYFTMTECVIRLANTVCNGRLVSVLEGGYGRMQWTESHVGSDTSTKAGSDDSPGSLRNGRKRMRPSITFTQTINRQPLGVGVLSHLKALLELQQS